jgi:hypothetical protein
MHEKEYATGKKVVSGFFAGFPLLLARQASQRAA